MHSVTVRIRAAEFSATMTEIDEWLDANRHKPTRYKYDHTDDAVLVTVDFPAAVAADAFCDALRRYLLLISATRVGRPPAVADAGRPSVEKRPRCALAS